MRRIAPTAAVFLIVGVGTVGDPIAATRPAEPKGKSTLRLRLTGVAPARQLEICGRTRTAHAVALGGRVIATIQLAGTDRRRTRRGRLIIERCEGGRFRLVRSERFEIAVRRGRVGGYRKRIDTSLAGDFRIRARLRRGGPRRPAITRSAYLQVSESRPEGDSRPEPFTYAGHCTELQLAVPVFGGAREVAEAVQPPFAPLGYPFAATVTVGVANCDSTTAGGTPIAAWTGGLAGIPVMPRAAGSAIERYWLWNVGSSPEVDAGLARLGLLTAAVPGIRLDVTSGAGFKEGLAEVPWPGEEYRLEARVADTAAVPLAGTSVFWHQGSRGLVKVTYEISNGNMLSGNGTVIATPGSRLARLIGPNASGFGVLITFDFESTAELSE